MLIKLTITITVPNGALSMISWLFINQTGHYTYQIKAEYLSYNMVSIIMDNDIENIYYSA